MAEGGARGPGLGVLSKLTSTGRTKHDLDHSAGLNRRCDLVRTGAEVSPVAHSWVAGLSAASVEVDSANSASQSDLSKVAASDGSLIESGITEYCC